MRQYNSSPGGLSTGFMPCVHDGAMVIAGGHVNPVADSSAKPNNINQTTSLPRWTAVARMSTQGPRRGTTEAYECRCSAISKAFSRRRCTGNRLLQSSDRIDGDICRGTGIGLELSRDFDNFLRCAPVHQARIVVAAFEDFVFVFDNIRERNHAYKWNSFGKRTDPFVVPSPLPLDPDFAPRGAPAFVIQQDDELRTLRHAVHQLLHRPCQGIRLFLFHNLVILADVSGDKFELPPLVFG